MQHFAAGSGCVPHAGPAQVWETPTGAATQLKINIAPAGPRCTVRLDGELDMATVAQLRCVLRPLCGGRHRLVIVDVGELRFLSLAGLQVLAEAEQTLRVAACRLVLSRPDAITVRVLGITGLERVLHVVPERNT